MIEANNKYKDVSLFNDVENRTLRNRNRGVVMGNYAMDGRERNKNTISPKASANLLGYFKEIPVEERKEVMQFFLDYLAENGYTVTKAAA